jgi:CRP/FNR family transcriptional regulator, cyclic AMP receptor protein
VTVSDPSVFLSAVPAEFRELGVVRRHRRGTYVILEGDRSDHVLVLRSGRLKIVRTTADGRETLVAVRGPGELVGDLNVLAGSDAERSASAIALDDVVVQAIPAAEFLRFVERHAAVSFVLLRQLASRLRESTTRHADAGGYDVLHRLARALLDEAEHRGRDVESGTMVATGLSQQDLAGLIAASPKSISRSLAVFRKRGLVATGRRSIVILDLDGLRRFTC